MSSSADAEKGEAGAARQAGYTALPPPTAANQVRRSASLDVDEPTEADELCDHE